MAESSAVAFGRYLRTLRERRGHSLDDVESLSRALPERIGKGYLSRCENGRQRVAFSKIITLCRVYDVPSEVLIERMELDLELDRVGGPETEGLEFEELKKEGIAATARGEMWNAYAYMRDALAMAQFSPVLEQYRGVREQELRAILNCTIPIARHGRHRLALHELEYVRSVKGLDELSSVALFELLSQRHRALGRLDKAARFANAAVDRAEKLGSDIHLAFAYSNKAVLAYHQKELDSAIGLYQHTFSTFSRLKLHNESARTLINLAQAYVDLGRVNAAKRSLLSAERISIRHDLRRSRALLRILMGEIAAREGNDKKALRLWREAVEFARKINDTILRFQAEFCIFKHAVETGDTATAASVGRLLARRSAWITESVAELDEFRILAQST